MSFTDPFLPSPEMADAVLTLQSYPTGPTSLGGAAGVSCISHPSCVSEASCASQASDVPRNATVWEPTERG